MPTYIAQINVNEDEFQNPQELMSIWGTIQEDIERLGGEILQTYAVLGGYDFHLAFEVESGEVAFQISQIIERHGLDTETMRTSRSSASANSLTISELTRQEQR